MPEYDISPKAETDLENIYYEGLLRFGMLQADKYQIALHQKFIFLAHHSSLGTGLTLKDKSFRKYPYKAHLILFESTENGISVLRVFHGSSDYFQYLEDYL